jgi:fermentation-respiration switch protein FrsA (DUF1100 family)
MGSLEDPDAAIRKAEKFSLTGVAGEVAMLFLIVHGADDRIVPVAAAHALHDAIGSREKALKIFTAGEGGSAHALADNRPIAINYIADWLAEKL